ncbi:MAG: thiamine pyrophosphate-dependent dehydrogenase E1 component subunit alpha [Roseovarius sp.]
MVLIRRFELAASERYRNGDMPGFIHLSIGQEACAAGACAALEERDFITSTHRGHGHCLAKGADPKRMMAELFARASGYCKGRGGSMHIADMSRGVLGANGIVGQSMPLAVGAALTAQVTGSGAVALAFFGEGASGAGVAHEAMNMAAIWKLPVIFFCEVNRYAELSPYEVHCPLERISDRAAAYGFPGETVDGEDVFAVHDAVARAATRARAGEGPSLIEAKAFRWHGHYEGDPQGYKTADERASPESFDPVARFERNEASLRGLSETDLENICAAAEAEIAAALEFAEAEAPATHASMLEDIYA